MKYLGVCVLVSLLSACATQTIDSVPEDQFEPEVITPEPQVITPAEPAVVSPPQPTPINIATESLTHLARAQYQANQYQSAIATAERGLRIDRRASSLYLVMAQSYMQLGLRDKAKNFVQQGLRFATPESDTEITLLRLRDILVE